MYYSASAYVRPSQIASSPYYSGTRKPVRPARVELYSADLATWDDGVLGDRIFTDTQPDELDEPWPYRFKSGEIVWICASDSKWYRGKVIGQAKQGKTRSEDALFWCVEFFVARIKVRKWFAPLNGDIKPDIEHTHRMLSNPIQTVINDQPVSG